MSITQGTERVEIETPLGGHPQVVVYRGDGAHGGRRHGLVAPGVRFCEGGLPASYQQSLRASSNGLLCNLF